VNFAEFFVTLAAATTFFLTMGFAAGKPIAGLAIGCAIAAPFAARLGGRIPAGPRMIGVGGGVFALSVRTILVSR
ncbi:MAG: sulfite exporter TauE/SafE family protein, partial [Thermoanaerobaculia bacterium]